MSGTFTGERALVIGLGIAGVAAARALALEGASVRVAERRDDATLPEELRALGVELRTGEHVRQDLEDVTLVVTSPGVPTDAPIVAWARERALSIWGELELGARLARVPYLAVTGTNGKTTTTGMLASCLAAAGIDAPACGNIGFPFPIAALEDHDALVVEASSFQLEVQTSFHPRVSVLLNLAPDHLDRHGTFAAYADAKRAVFARQSGDDVHLGNRDDEIAAAISREAACEVRWFTLGEPAAGEVGFIGRALTARWGPGPEVLGALALDTPATRADAAAAAAAANAFGVDADAIRDGLAAFVPARHRGEVVATVDGVRFVDNSKATNPHATLAALGDAEGVVLIAGGDAKGVELAPIGALAPRLAGVVALGAAAGEVVRIFEGRVPTRTAGSIEEAVGVAFELAPRPGTVLLAPACASWDMFRDYGERGDRFAGAARAVAERASA
jgi:UDP-N-acetylmuramoylalanine--D-glutamate ligase